MLRTRNSSKYAGRPGAIRRRYSPTSSSVSASALYKPEPGLAAPLRRCRPLPLLRLELLRAPKRAGRRLLLREALGDSGEVAPEVPDEDAGIVRAVVLPACATLRSTTLRIARSNCANETKRSRFSSCSRSARRSTLEWSCCVVSHNIKHAPLLSSELSRHGVAFRSNLVAQLTSRRLRRSLQSAAVAPSLDFLTLASPSAMRFILRSAFSTLPIST